jgi:hypothetical protein
MKDNPLQLEFPFIIQFAAADTAYKLKQREFERIFNCIDFSGILSRFAKEYFRSGEIFIYSQSPQLTFPHSDYWGCEECEP